MDKHMSACLSGTRRYSIDAAKQFCIILDFPYQTVWQYSDGDPPPNGGIKCKGSVKV